MRLLSWFSWFGLITSTCQQYSAGNLQVPFPSERFAAAERQLRGGQFQKSLAAFQAIQRDHPQLPMAHSGIAESLLGVNQHVQALTAFERALSLCQDCSNQFGFAVRLQVGTTLGLMLRHEEALSVFEQAVDIRPNDFDGNFQLGLGLNRLDNVTGTIRVLERLLQIPRAQLEAPEDCNEHRMRQEAYLVLAGNFLMLGSNQDAANAATAARAQLSGCLEDPAVATRANKTLGKALVALGDIHQAQQVLGRPRTPDSAQPALGSRVDAARELHLQMRAAEQHRSQLEASLERIKLEILAADTQVWDLQRKIANSDRAAPATLSQPPETPSKLSVLFTEPGLSIYRVKHFASAAECAALEVLLNETIQVSDGGPPARVCFVKGSARERALIESGQMVTADLEDINEVQRCFKNTTSADPPVLHPSVSVIVGQGQSRVAETLGERAEEIVGLQSRFSVYGQLLQYQQQTEHYGAHTDCTLDPEEDTRAFTMLLYLNNVHEGGGGTLFNHLNLTIQPEAGTAIVFNSLHKGFCNARSLHTAMPLETASRKSGTCAETEWRLIGFDFLSQCGRNGTCNQKITTPTLRSKHNCKRTKRMLCAINMVVVGSTHLFQRRVNPRTKERSANKR